MTDNQNRPPELSGDGKTRRRALLGISSALGGIGTAAAVVPFVAGMRPSRKTRADGAPVKVALNGINEGDLRVVVWRQKPVWVLRRNKLMLDALNHPATDLSDPASDNSSQPDYCKNKTRSITPEYFIALGLCTHLGCSPGRETGHGFLCACHGSRFDFAGRVFEGSPAPKNLFIPPHYFDDNNNVVIGTDAAV